MRYLLYSYQPEPALDEGLLLSGLFHWPSAMRGQVGSMPPKQVPANFDAVHLNLTTASLGLLGELSEACRGTSCQLVVNCDYAVDSWSRHFDQARLWLRELDKANVIFHVEPRGAHLLETALHRPVHVIPHPISTTVSSFAVRYNERPRNIHSVVHRYDMQISEAWLLTSAVQKRLSEGFGKHVGNGVSLAMVAPPQELTNRLPNMFDWFLSQENYAAWIRRLAKSWVVFDTHTCSIFGRVVGECAALGVPCVGNASSYAMRRLFPRICFDREDTEGKFSALIQLAMDTAFYKEVSEFAYRAVHSTFSYAQARHAMLSALGVKEPEPVEKREDKETNQEVEVNV